MRKLFSILIVTTAVILAYSAVGAADPAKHVYFIEPKNGTTVTNPIKVKFGIDGMTIKPAGEIVDGTGHHHLLIDLDPVPAGQVIPADETHLHFGKGQTETEVKLTPGSHKLTMQFANGAHISYGPELSATITVIVK